MPRPPITDKTTINVAGRIRNLEALLVLTKEVPKSWKAVKAHSNGQATTNGDTPVNLTGGDMDPLPCTSYKVLINAWRRALRWTDGLDRALSVMLASITSTKSVGDQLWIKIIGPAACGKSTLCEAVSVNKDYVLAKSTIRGFHSGWRETGEDSEDNSLVAMVAGKTLVTKDGDTLLQSPNLSQILAEARDLYDSTSRTHYRNTMSKDYSGIRMTWLLCGTSSLRSIDESELGERFLDCVIMDGIDDALEDEVLWRVANRADRNLAIEADGGPESHYEPELATAMRLTGGYVTHLRTNAKTLLGSITSPTWVLRRCTQLGKFVAFMRARPSLRQEETAEREFAARLVSQHIRLAKCLAAVMNRSEVDRSVMERVTKVCLDTARGQTMLIAQQLHTAGTTKGAALRAIALATNTPENKTRELLRFLQRIDAVESFSTGTGIGGNKARWRLTAKLQTLYTTVLEGE